MGDRKKSDDIEENETGHNETWNTKKKEQKEIVSHGFSSLLVFIGMLSVAGVMFLAVTAAATTTATATATATTATLTTTIETTKTTVHITQAIRNNFPSYNNILL
jgi:hypothetical protein